MKCSQECPEGKNATGCCCKECVHVEGCASVCTDTPDTCGNSLPDDDDGTSLMLFTNTTEVTMEAIAAIVKKKTELEDKEKTLKEDLLIQMEKYDVKKFSNHILTITYVAPSVSSSFDRKGLKANYPAIEKQFTTSSSKCAYVKIALK